MDLYLCTNNSSVTQLVEHLFVGIVMVYPRSVVYFLLLHSALFLGLQFIFCFNFRSSLRCHLWLPLHIFSLLFHITFLLHLFTWGPNQTLIIDSNKYINIVISVCNLSMNIIPSYPPLLFLLSSFPWEFLIP